MHIDAPDLLPGLVYHFVLEELRGEDRTQNNVDNGKCFLHSSTYTFNETIGLRRHVGLLIIHTPIRHRG